MRRRQAARSGRDVPALLADFGHRFRPAPAVKPNPRERTVFTVPAGRHGRTGRGVGWCAVPAPVAVYRMTSEQAPGVWPLIAGPGLPATGAPIGIDFLTGGAFHADPVGWTTSDAVPVTNPNVIVFGEPGRGKSTTVKHLCLGLMPYGYRTLVLGDVKDEYEPLCRAVGVTPQAIGPGLPARINPLDFGPLGEDWTSLGRAEAQRRAAVVFGRWLMLLRGLVGSQAVPFGPSAEAMVGAALAEITGYVSGADRMTETTIPRLWHALTEPSPALVRECRYASRQHFLDDTRGVRDALGALVRGHLAGLFDAPTTVRVDWHAPIQSLSLSRLRGLGDEAVGVALTCLNSWGRAMTEIAQPGDLRIIIRDECWRQMRLGVDAVKSLDADLRLSRADGAVQVVVAHKPSDMLTVGDAGSQAVAIAQDLLHLCATKVLFGQDRKIGDELSGLLGLPETAQRIVTDWATAATGRALWVVGSHHAKVQTIRGSAEIPLTDTNQTITRPALTGVEVLPHRGAA